MQYKLHFPNNPQVALLQYPDGVFSFAHGDVDEVSGNDVHYRFGTASGSSGSPLLNWAAQAVAMHKLGEAPRSATSTPAASLLSSASASLSSASSTPKLSPTPTPTASPSQTLTQVPTTQQPDLQRTASLLSVVVEAYFRERPTSISVPYVAPHSTCSCCAPLAHLLSVFRFYIIFLYSIYSYCIRNIRVQNSDFYRQNSVIFISCKLSLSLFYEYFRFCQFRFRHSLYFRHAPKS